MMAAFVRLDRLAGWAQPAENGPQSGCGPDGRALAGRLEKVEGLETLMVPSIRSYWPIRCLGPLLMRTVDEWIRLKTR